MHIDRDAALKQAEKLLRQGKLDGAIAEYVRLVEDQPRDWNAVNALGDLYVRAGDMDRAAAQFTQIADHLFAEGFLPRAAALYKKALKIQPEHQHTLLRLSEIATRQGLLADARMYLRALGRQRRDRGDTLGAAECLVRLALLEEADAETKLAGARAAQALGNPAQAVELFRDAAEELRKVGRDADAIEALSEAVAMMPSDMHLRAYLARECLIAGRIEQAYALAEVVADDALVAGDWQRAINALRGFLEHGSHLPALIRLLELAVDAGRDDVMHLAQERLADAYLDLGRGAEARVIAEDLVAREPTSDAHAARLRRALALLGGGDAEAIIARYRQPAGESPVALEPAVSDPVTPVAVPEPDLPPAAPAQTMTDDDAIVLDMVEIDLSDALAGLGTASPPLTASPQTRAEEPPTPPPDLESVF